MADVLEVRDGMLPSEKRNCFATVPAVRSPPLGASALRAWGFALWRVHHAFKARPFGFQGFGIEDGCVSHVFKFTLFMTTHTQDKCHLLTYLVRLIESLCPTVSRLFDIN